MPPEQSPGQQNGPQQLNIAEALVVILMIALVGVVAYFDFASGKVSKGNQGIGTIVAAVFAFATIKLIMKVTRGHKDNDDDF